MGQPAQESANQSTERQHLSGDQTAEQVKHTPGPWSYTWNEGETNDGHVYTQNGTIGIAIVEGSNWGAWRDADDSGEAEFEANARLIAAAPDLLEALGNTLSLLKCFTRETDDVAKACWDQAEAAIAKATSAAVSERSERIVP